MGGRILKGVVCLALLLGACSTAPRPYAPQLAAAPSDAGRFQSDVAECAQLVASGRDPGGSGRVKTAAAGTAIGLGAGAATAGSAASGAGMLSGAAAGAGLATGFLLAAPVATVVIAKTIRSRKEREIKLAEAGCLHERGWEVAGWVREK